MRRLFSLLLILAMLLAACGQTPEPETAPATVDTVQEALPQTEDTTVYQMTLTPEQVESYDNGHFLLLQHVGGDVYVPFYTSKNVTLEGQTLTANFNGKVPYVYNDVGQCYLPFITEGETRDGKTQYKIPVSLENYESGGWGYEMENGDLYLLCDRASGQICNAQFLTDGQEPEGFFEGNQPQAEHTAPALYYFSGGSFYLVAKDENRILPTENWTSKGGAYVEWEGEKGLQTAYGRLAQVTEPYPVMDVYMLIVARNEALEETLSELIPVSVATAPKMKTTTQAPMELTWSEGNQLLLLQEEGVSVYLRKTSDWGTIAYDLQVKNESDTYVSVELSEILLNGNIYLDNVSALADVGKWGTGTYPLRFPLGAALGEIDRAESLQFTLKLRDYNSFMTILEQDVRLTLSGSASLKAYCVEPETAPQRMDGEFSQMEAQVLTEQAGVKVTALKTGWTKDKTNFACWFKVENTSDQWRYVKHGGLSVNGISFNGGIGKDLQPGSTNYFSITLTEDELVHLQQIGSVSLGICVLDSKLQSSYSLPDTVWYPITGQSAAEAPTELPEGELLLEEQGLRITMLEQTTDYADRPVWKVLVENTTDRTVFLKPAEGLLNGLTPEYNKITLYNNIVPAGQRAILEVRADGSENASFLLEVQNEQGSSILFTTEGRVQLKAQ